MIIEWLDEPQQASLCRAFNVWLEQGPLRRFPDIHLSDLSSLKEMRIMLAETINNWKTTKGSKKELKKVLKKVLNKVSKNII